ncbi:hypothetical protein [Acidovorax sp. Leaf78]|uniref:hypothetical protein n=1 Tax=Acidovorax sp. Leaf78 TaxID=1736237 RepID=UPI0012E0F9DB|nr:hypothetical protein [Acidovorax sp. Leaf78]
MSLSLLARSSAASKMAGGVHRAGPAPSLSLMGVGIKGAAKTPWTVRITMETNTFQHQMARDQYDSFARASGSRNVENQ